MEKKYTKTAVFMIYLTLSLTLFMTPAKGLEPDVSVNKATGDLNVNVPLASIESPNGFISSDIMLSYIGGDGIRVGDTPTSVGLGWALNNPSINRMVMGIPDDLNVREQGDDKIIFETAVSRCDPDLENSPPFQCPNGTSGSWQTISCADQFSDPDRTTVPNKLECSGFDSSSHYPSLKTILENDIYGSSDRQLFEVSIGGSSQVNFWQYMNEDTRVPSVPWYVKAVLIVVSVVVTIASIVSAPFTGGASLSLSTVLLGMLYAIAVGVVLTVTIAAMDAMGLLTNLDFDAREMLKQQFSFSWKDGLQVAMALVPSGSALGAAAELATKLQNTQLAKIYSYKQQGQMAIGALNSAGNQLLTSRPLQEDIAIRYSEPGSFYNEFPFRDNIMINSIYDYSNVSFRESDFGQPDVYSVSGPYSGKLIPGSEIRGIIDDKFVIGYPRKNDWALHPEYNSLGGNPSGPNTNVKVEVKTDLFQMVEGAAQEATDMCKKHFSTAFCEDERNHFVEDYIDQIIITAPNGQKAVYGDPNVEGSIVRSHRTGHSTYTGVVMDSGEGSFHQRKTNLQFTSHPIEWKLVAILAPNYEYYDTNQYPLSLGNPSGDWIAYKYDQPFSMKNPSNQCGYVDGLDAPTIDMWEYYGDHPDGAEQVTRRQWNADIVDISHLSEIHTSNTKIEYNYDRRPDKKSSRPWNGGVSGFGPNYPWFCRASDGGNYCALYPELGFTSRRMDLAYDFTEREGRKDNPLFTDLWTPKNAGGDLERLDDCTMNMSDYDGESNQDYKLTSLKVFDKINSRQTREINLNYDYSLMHGFRAIPYDPASSSQITGALTLLEVEECIYFDGVKTCKSPLEFNYNNYENFDAPKGGLI